MGLLRTLAAALAKLAAENPPCRLRHGFMGMTCATCGGNDFGGRFACRPPREAGPERADA